MTSEDIRLHGLSFENEKLLMAAKKCGCFYCGRMFTPSDVTDWAIDEHGRTAICPYCGIDPVLQEAADDSYVLDGKLLRHMNEVWFNNAETSFVGCED